MKQKKLLWLDDIRDPFENGAQWLVFSPIEITAKDVVWVKSYEEFTDWIKTNGLPDGICFDHDLGFTNEYYIENNLPSPEPDKTGMDCAKWLCEYCLEKKESLPKYNIQSANPAGKANIDGLLKSFIKHQNL